MSTILDVLRKAQEDARGRATRQRIEPGELPGLVLERERPRRRFRPWMLVPVGLVVLAGVAGGLFLTEGARVPRARREGLAGDPGAGAPVVRDGASAPKPATSEPVTPAAGPGAPAPAPPAPVSAAAAPAAAPVAPAAPATAVAGGDAPPAAPAIPTPGPAVVAAVAPPPAPRAAATRAPLGRPAAEPAPAAGAPLGDHPIGVPRPPAYLEKRIGPSGKAETRLLPVDPSSLARGEPRVLQPTPQERKRPLVRRAEELAEEGAVTAESPPDAHADATGELLPGEPAEGAPGRAASEPPPKAVEVRRLPGGLPEVELNIVQWSPSPSRRFAFVRVDGSAMVKVREGDEVGGLLVVRIHPDGLELAQDQGRWLLRTD